MHWFVAFSLGGMLASAASLIPDPPREHHRTHTHGAIVRSTPRPVHYPTWQRQPARERTVAKSPKQTMERDR